VYRVGRELGVLDRIDAVGAQEAIIPLLSAADLFLLPSAQESFGLAALEAMACEVPVVASRVGGLPEVIEHGVAGFLHPPDDLDALAASAVALLTEPALHRRVAAAARRTVRERFCADRIVPMYEKYYESVLRGV
jgi:glycosyltransferase involved in cell wall biosynthesis